MVMRTLSWWQPLWYGFLNLTCVHRWLPTNRVALPKKVSLNLPVMVSLRCVSHHILAILSLLLINHDTCSFLNDWVLRSMDQITRCRDKILLSSQIVLFFGWATSLAIISRYLVFYSRKVFLAALIWLWRGYLGHLSTQIVAYIKGQTVSSLRTLLWRH